MEKSNLHAIILSCFFVVFFLHYNIWIFFMLVECITTDIDWRLIEERLSLLNNYCARSSSTESKSNLEVLKETLHRLQHNKLFENMECFFKSRCGLVVICYSLQSLVDRHPLRDNRALLNNSSPSTDDPHSQRSPAQAPRKKGKSEYNFSHYPFAFFFSRLFSFTLNC